MTDIDTLRAALGDKAVRVEQIGGQVLIQGDCRDIMPLLGKVDAVVACCDAVVYTDKHGKTANWEPETPARGGVDMGKPQGRNRGPIHKRNNVARPVGCALRVQPAGRGQGAASDGHTAKIERQGGRTERALHRRDAKHDLQADGGKDPLQQVRGNQPTRCASCGRGPHEQRGRKFGSALQSLPFQPSQTGMVGLPKGFAVLTDPPYGVGAENHAGPKSSGWTQWDRKEWDSSRPDAAIFEWLVSATDGVIIWGGNYFSDLLPPSMRWLIWDKGQREFSLADFEMAWTSQQKAARAFDYPRALAMKDGKQHPTQKPIALMEWCLGFLPNAQTILDPFAGSGTVAVACQRLGRQSISIELDPDYFKIMCGRVQEAVNNPPLFEVAPTRPKQVDFDL